MGLFLPLLLAWQTAWAGVTPSPQELVYEIRVGNQTVGTREVKVRMEDIEGDRGRFIESFTDIGGQVGPVLFSYQQRLTGFSTDTPASFHSVINENGLKQEVQGRWTSAGWTVTIVDSRESRTFDHPASWVDLSTVDLIDPGTKYVLGRYDNVKVLSAETGDIWEGGVSPIGTKTLTLSGRDVVVDGVSWASPEGRTEFWYNAEGHLVQYNMRLLGFRVEGTLKSPPPPGADEFRVATGSASVEEVSL
jgi:hypothetical protein